MDPESIQEVVLQRQEVEQQVVVVPRDQASERSGDGVEDEVVCGRDNGGENNAGVDHANANCRKPLPAHPALASEGHAGDGETDEERVAEMERRHGSCRSCQHCSILDA